MIGAQGSAYLEPEKWMFGLGYRYQYSHRHFVGRREQEDRGHENSEVKNYLHLFDLSMTYGLSEQTTLTLSVPYQIADRTQQNGDFPDDPRRNTHANGFGDVSLIARRWMFDVKENVDQNIALGFGFKMPTGDPSTEDSRKVLNEDTGEPEIIVQTNDQSIQPGDGGIGFSVELQAFKRFGQFTPYAQGSYLFNPEEDNGVLTGRSRAGEEIMSVPDQYILRAGSMFVVPSIEKFSFGLGGRMEGIPTGDVFGGSDGFRRPGYAISVEPQLIFVPDAKNVFSLSVPIALIRNRQQSKSDDTNERHGDAAFADWILLLSWTHKF